MRTMYDAIANDVGFIPHNAEMVAGYDTGTPDIKWTTAMYGMFPQAEQVHINQGYQSPARITSHVIDVESGAWRPVDVPLALAEMEANGVERPTVYCSRNTIGLIPKLPKVYDLWIAWPGYNATVAPMQPGWNTVAVQYAYPGNFDISKVFDDAWPHKAATPGTEAEMLHELVSSEDFVPFPAGAFKTLHLYRDFVSPAEPSMVRLAFHVGADTFHVMDVDLTAPKPEVISMPATTVDAITISVTSGRTPVGYTLA